MEIQVAPFPHQLLPKRRQLLSQQTIYIPTINCAGNQQLTNEYLHAIVVTRMVTNFSQIGFFFFYLLGNHPRKSCRNYISRQAKSAPSENKTNVSKQSADITGGCLWLSENILLTSWPWKRLTRRSQFVNTLLQIQ